MAACSPSAARLEQCILAGGRPPRASATALLVISTASSSFLPLAISVTMLEVATAAPQPRVWNLMSSRVVVLDLDGDAHHVAALRVADLAHAVGVFDDAHVARVAEMFHHEF